MKETAYARFGEVAILMNNAGIGNGGGPFENYERWRRLMEVNLWGQINGVQTLGQTHDRPGHARGDRQYRLQAGHHHPTEAIPPTTSPRPG